MISPAESAIGYSEGCYYARLRCVYIAPNCCTRSRWLSCRQDSTILLSSVQAIDSLHFEVAGILLGKGTAQTALPSSIL
jgi:hypothetical protein